MSQHIYATSMPVVTDQTMEWRAIKKAMKMGLSLDCRVKNKQEAIKLINQAKPKLEDTRGPHKAGYQIHESHATSQTTPYLNLEHIKWKDSVGKGSRGHIFF